MSVSRFIAVAHATAQGLCPCSVIVALLMLALGSTGAADNPALSPEDSRFVRTVVHLQQSEPELRADFVEVALVLLAEAYADEASLAREAATVAADNDKLLGWAAAVERYSQQLPLLVEDVELGFPARLTLGVDGVLSISVAERRLMLMHPAWISRQCSNRQYLRPSAGATIARRLQSSRQGLNPFRYLRLA